MNPADSTTNWRRVCRADDVAAKGKIEVLLDRKLALILWLDGGLRACAGLCPHAFAPLVDGAIEDGRIHCARHKASFDLQTGAPDPHWRIAPLPIYGTRIIDGWVEIDAPQASVGASS